ncbi:MAG: hypothetical protein ACLFWM_00565 [Actinomycetota bacterium]
MKAVRIVVLLVATLLVSLSLPAAAQPPSELVRLSGWSLAVEVRGLDVEEAAQVEGLWGEFVAGAPAHSACLLARPPVVAARPDMAPRAAYAPGSSTLYVKPGDLDRLVVFHELAHHLDFACGAAEAVGSDLRAAQGIPGERAWWKEGDPVTWPAEYFANAVAIALGEESRHDVTDATVGVVEEWMGRTRAVVTVPPVPVLTIGETGPGTPRVS